MVPMSERAAAPIAADTWETIMAALFVLYKTPTDPAAFDTYYFEKHIPLAKTIPGLRKYTVTQGPVVSPAGPTPLHLVAILEFDDMGAIQHAFASAEGQAAAADLQKICRTSPPAAPIW
jgi:uncharacterized protein (TIGR02118 family)